MMKAKFENIGPIKKAELELGGLTIIAGQNNTGKTYLVYTLYGFLNFLREQDRDFVYFLKYNEFPNAFYGRIKSIALQMRDTGSARLDIEEYKGINKNLVKSASSFFSSELLAGVFSSPNGEFSNSKFNLETNYDDELIIESKFMFGRGGEQRLVIDSSLEDNTVIFRLKNPEGIRIPSNIVEQGIVALFFIKKNWPSPFILSAERFGISLFYKELDFTKNRLVEELQKLPNEKYFDPFRFLQKESARYAKPIKDNIDFTRDLSRISKRRSLISEDMSKSITKMMEGYYKEKNDEIRFISKRRGDNRFDIPLHLASSSARGVSDLYFYLKHVAEPGQILIIDEPESHLSPTNQILMARLLVFCVNSGLKVLITTHSDYLIKEINNLIMLNGEFEGKKDFLRKNRKKYTDEDSLNPEQVRAYICEDGTLKPCSVDRLGIDMPVFDNAIDEINEISMELALQVKGDDS